MKSKLTLVYNKFFGIIVDCQLWIFARKTVGRGRQLVRFWNYSESKLIANLNYSK